LVILLDGASNASNLFVIDANLLYSIYLHFGFVWEVDITLEMTKRLCQ
jgi:hypothetical protein